MNNQPIAQLGSYTPSGRSGVIVDPNGLCPTITTGNHGNVIGVAYEEEIEEMMVEIAGSLNRYGFGQADRVIGVSGISPTIITKGDQIGHQINILVEEDDEDEEDL